MPYCPNCKSEYREGFTVCADCGTTLVEGPQGDGSPASSKEPPALDNPQLLVTIADVVELGMCTGLLEDAGILFAVRDHHPAGGYLRAYMGKLTYGQQVYVSERDLEPAKELLEGYLSAEPLEAEVEEPQPDEAPASPHEGRATRAYNARRNLMRWCIIGVVALWVVAMLVSALMAALQ